MWLIKLIKKVLRFALFIAFVGIMAIIFIGSFWFDNDYQISKWASYFNEPVKPSGALTAMFDDVSKWFDDITKDETGIKRIFYLWSIPIGFSAVFGIIIYTAISIIFHIIYKIIKNKKNKKKYAKNNNNIQYVSR